MVRMFIKFQFYDYLPVESLKSNVCMNMKLFCFVINYFYCIVQVNDGLIPSCKYITFGLQFIFMFNNWELLSQYIHIKLHAQ
jgi:hypothetical protein